MAKCVMAYNIPYMHANFQVSSTPKSVLDFDKHWVIEANASIYILLAH